MNNITVLLFANLREIVGRREVVIELGEDAKVRDLKINIIEKFPELEPYIGTIIIAVNREYAFDEDPISEGAEVALFPPVSGGSNREMPTFFAITDEEIDINDLVSRISLPSTGAAGIFSGMVRGITTRGEIRRTEYLEYEAYKPMAESKLKQVAEEIREKWPSIEGIAIVQRTGRIYPGTTTILIACTAAHRDTGVFEAARYGIDRVKEIVPVWKKEVSPKGEIWIEGEYAPTPQD